jgi:cyanophycinase
MMNTPSSRGTMILIGGREDKHGERLILNEVARRASGGSLVVATLASEEPDLQWERYSRLFRDLGVIRVDHLAIANREDAMDARLLEMFTGACGIFFTGGDQVKIATKLGGTELFARIRDLYARGGLIAGTSAGAAAMGEAMLVSHGPLDDSHKVEGAFYMARGLGLVGDLIIDQHFAQRARIERLLGAIGESPGVLGIGIDEDTAVVLDADECFEVIGSGAVYVVDGRGLTHTNVSERASGSTMSLFDVTLHVLDQHTGFDVKTRRPFRKVSVLPTTRRGDRIE